MKYILIDGNNLACRCAFSQEGLTNSEGMSTSVHFGFFNNILSLKQKFPDGQFLIVWDGKSARRMKESDRAVEMRIIPESYKANRKKEVMPKPLLDFYEQAPYLQKGLGQTGIPQIRMPEYEADDIVASYCKLLKGDNEIICVTSDKDYMQLLDAKNNVVVYDGMKNKLITENSFFHDFGITPSQHIDCGALQGDDGDNIFGVPSWGEKTAIKEIKTYGSWEKLINAYKEKHKGLLAKYPDYPNEIPSDEEAREFEINVIEAKTEKGKIKFPDIKMNMPFARVLLAFAKEEIKIPKTEIMALCFQERIKLAYSLKKMDSDIPNLPEITQGEVNADRLMEYFEYFDMETLKDEISVFEK